MVAFSVFGRDIYRYGIMYLISFVIGYGLLYMIGRTNFFSDKQPNIHTALTKDLDTIIILVIIGVMLGGRLWYVIIYERQYFAQNLEQILAIRTWWMSFIGWMIGVFLTIGLRWLYKRWNRNDALSLFDSILSIAPIGIVFGRIGNFLNQEIYGIVIPENVRWFSSTIIKRATDLQLFYIYETVDKQLRVNTNFLSAFFEWLVILIICGSMMIVSIRRNRWQPGKISAMFMIWYSVVRFFLEYLRVDSQSEFIGIFTRSQYFFIFFMMIGLYLLRAYPHQSKQG